MPYRPLGIDIDHYCGPLMFGVSKKGAVPYLLYNGLIWWLCGALNETDCHQIFVSTNINGLQKRFNVPACFSCLYVGRNSCSITVVLFIQLHFHYKWMPSKVRLSSSIDSLNDGCFSTWCSNFQALGSHASRFCRHSPVYWGFVSLSRKLLWGSYILLQTVSEKGKKPTSLLLRATWC